MTQPPEAPRSKPKIYVMDSSPLLTLHQISTSVIPIPDEVWDRLNSLLEDGSMVSIRCVYDEIVVESDKPDKISAWLKPKKSHFPKPTHKQIEYMAEVVGEFPGLIKADSEREQADPYLIAFAREMNETDTGHEYVIVTQENPNSPVKIPAAAKHYSVKSMNLSQFMEEVGINLSMSGGK